MDQASLDDRIDSLYRDHPRDFVARRNELARELKDEGDAAAAKAVRRRRKPTLAAWALNVVAEQDRGRVDELRAAGAAVRRSQQRAVAGDDSELRQGEARRRELIRDLTERAVRHAGEAQRDRIEATLSAASVDDAIGEQLSAGRLTTPRRRPSGLGDLAAIPTDGDRPDRRRRDRARAKRLERRVSKLRRDLERHRSERDRAAKRLDDAQKAAAAAQQRVEEDESALAAAEAELDAASA